MVIDEQVASWEPDHGTTSADHLELIRSADRFGAGWLGVEDCRHLSRRFKWDLLAGGESIVRVPPKLIAHARDAARSYRKSDPIDALAVARAAPREPDLPVAHFDGPPRDAPAGRYREDLFRTEPPTSTGFAGICTRSIRAPSHPHGTCGDPSTSTTSQLDSSSSTASSLAWPARWSQPVASSPRRSRSLIVSSRAWSRSSHQRC